MSRNTHVRNDNLDTLAEDARALLTATAETAEEKVIEARERLAAALDSGKEICARVRDKAVDKARAADQVVRGHPYHAIGIAFGVGALLVFLLKRRR